MLPGGRAFANPRAIPELLMCTVSYQKITTKRILLGKKADWLICQGQEKLKRFVKASVLDFMHAFLHCLSSQNYIVKSGGIDVNQRFLVIESNFC